MIQLTEAHIADFFSQACAILGQRTEEVRSLFPNASFNFISRIQDSVLEITAGHFSLSCLVNNENRCEKVYVFINKENELEVAMVILRHCKSNYPYSYLLKMWINDVYGIDLRTSQHPVIVAISKTDRLPLNQQRALALELSLHLN